MLINITFSRIQKEDAQNPKNRVSTKINTISHEK